jgi:hypothetical protein
MEKIDSPPEFAAKNLAPELVLVDSAKLCESRIV